MKRIITTVSLLVICGITNPLSGESIGQIYARGRREMQEIHANNMREFNDFCGRMMANMPSQNFYNPQMAMQQQMAAAAMLAQQLGNELRAQFQWFAVFGDAALQNNPAEFQNRIARLQQIHTLILNITGPNNFLQQLQMVINFLQNYYNQNAPRHQPIGRATPRYA